MTLHYLKNQHATDHGFTDWQDLRESVQDDTEYENHWHAVCVRAQEQALSNATKKISDKIDFYSKMNIQREEQTFLRCRTLVINKQNLVQ